MNTFNLEKEQISSKGITLIALVITIIVLLILAGISIAMLTGENGILKKAVNSSDETKKQQYIEEIKLEAMEEQMERNGIQKEDAFIRSIYNRLMGNDKKEKKSWINNATMCNEEYETESNDYNNTLLIVETKDEYEIFINVDNEKLNIIIEEIFQSNQEYIVHYDPNTGIGDMDMQKIREGYLCTLSLNKFSKENFSFVGWCKDKEGNGKIYTEGSKIKITEETTLYAIWKEETITITFDANGGNGNMENLKIAKNAKTILPTNKFTRTGYVFGKWNTKADGTGKAYSNNTEITTENENITLYAIWGPLYIYNEGTIAGYPIVFSNNRFSLGTNNISFNYVTNNYLYCSTAIPNNYNTLHVSIKATPHDSETWAACRVGIRPTYYSDGSSSFSNYFIPLDWYKMGIAAKYGDADDSDYRDYRVDLSGVNAESYYFFIHTAGFTWNINKIWFE